MRTRWGVALGLLGATALFAACTVTKQPVSPHEVHLLDESETLVVRTTGGGQGRLRNVSVGPETLRGTTPSGDPFEVAFEDIEFVETERNHTKVALALIPAAAVAGWLIHGASTAPSPPPSQSCPFVYVHDGQSLVFQAEPYGGAIVPALERTEWTPLPAIQPVDGEYRMRVANELDETQHIDEARLVVVDHPAGTTVAADPYGDIHLFTDPIPPTVARDSRGRDLTGVLRETDRRAWRSSYEAMDARTRETLRDPLVLEFPKPPGARTVRLAVNGATSLWGAQVARDFLSLRGSGLDDWYRRLETSDAELFTLLEWFDREGLYVLPIEVATPDGWEPREALFGSGPFAYKTTAYLLDIADVPGETLRLRLPVPVGFWVLNSVVVDYGDPAEAAGPEGFAPEVETTVVGTTTERDGRGRPLRSLLSADDDRALVLSERGDYVDLAYSVPPPTDGERTVFLKITGHYEVHLPAVGTPDHATLARVLEEPGYTLRFAFERYRSGAGDAVGSP